MIFFDFRKEERRKWPCNVSIDQDPISPVYSVKRNARFLSRQSEHFPFVHRRKHRPFFNLFFHSLSREAPPRFLSSTLYSILSCSFFPFCFQPRSPAADPSWHGTTVSWKFLNRELIFDHFNHFSFVSRFFEKLTLICMYLQLNSHDIYQTRCRLLKRFFYFSSFFFHMLSYNCAST